MARKTRKLVLKERKGAMRKTDPRVFIVVKAVNTITYPVGSEVLERDVQALCDRKGWTIEVTRG